MNFETLQVSRDQELKQGCILLNRPEKRNALNATMVGELRAAHQELCQDDHVRVIILRASGDAFCAGADLQSIAQLQHMNEEENRMDGEKLKTLFSSLYQSPKPLIAVVEGPAFAGGAGLATCCDFVLASEEASFAYPEVKIGFVAALVMVLLTRQVGERRARDLVLSGRVIKAQEALRLGLVNQVLAAQELEQSLEKLVRGLHKNSPQAMALSKELLTKVWDKPLEEGLELALDMNVRARSGPECREGVAAFLEKRKPDFSL